MDVTESRVATDIGKNEQQNADIFGRRGYRPRWICNNTKVYRAHAFSRQFLIVEVTPQARVIGVSKLE